MQRNGVLRFSLVCCICLVGALVSATQTRAQRGRTPPKAQRPAKSRRPTRPEAAHRVLAEPSPEPEQQDVETLKITTNLVTVPVIATSREGNYIPDLRQDEFSVSENGVKQEVAFFATVSAPFHVVLMLDTSGSTQRKDRSDPAGGDHFRGSTAKRRIA